MFRLGGKEGFTIGSFSHVVEIELESMSSGFPPCTSDLLINPHVCLSFTT